MAWLALGTALVLGSEGGPSHAQAGASAPSTTIGDAGSAPASASGQPLSAAELEALLPPSVFFYGKSAPLQLRNAGGVRFGSEGLVLASLVDSAGYASTVQQTYQFYLLTQIALRFGGQTIPPGAYGAGFVAGNKFVVMDIGNHVIARGATETDSALARPRPLQVRAERPGSVRLYLGRRFVSLEAATPEAAAPTPSVIP